MNLYILLTNTGTILTRIIGLFTGYKYNHVSFGFDKNLECIYSFGRLKPRNPFIGGFVEENINEGLYKIKKNTRGLVLKIKIDKNLKSKIEENLKPFITEKHLYGYNTYGLINNALGRNNKKNHRNYFCSEFAAKIFSESKVYDFKKPDVLVRPEDFLKINRVVTVYEGLLINYNKKLVKKPLHLWISFVTILKLIKGSD